MNDDPDQRSWEGRMRSESMSWVARGAGLTVGVGLILVLAGVVSAAREVVLLVFVAVLLGAALEPVVGTIRGRTGIGRGLSILIVYATFLAAVVGIAVFLVPAAVVQSVGLSPFLVLVSLLVGGAVAGILGAIVAVPVVAGITVVLGRLQDRETPVPIDPAAIEATIETESTPDVPGAAPDAPARPRRRKASAARA